MTETFSTKRYFFDLVDGETIAPDEEGLDLPTLEAAEEEAAIALATLARDLPPQAGGHRDIAVQVRDDAGPLMAARFDFAVRTLQ